MPAFVQQRCIWRFHLPVTMKLFECLMVIFGLLSLCLTAYAADDNENTTPTQWWMYSGQTAADVANTLNSLNARIVDIKVDNLSPYPFTATYVQNTGVYGKQWWWYEDIDGPTLAKYVSENKARLVSFKAYDIGGGQIRFAAAMIANSGVDAKAWWYYAGLRGEDITRLVQTNNARLTSLQSYESNGQTLYAVIMISNTGTDGKSWWWYANIAASDIGRNLTTNKARLLDITSSGNGNFNAVMESCATNCPAWWWYVGQSGDQILAEAQSKNARIITSDTYPGCGSYCFAAVMLSGSLGTQHGGPSQRLRGFVDLHTHPLSTLGFGGKLVYGGIDVGALLPADPGCNQKVRASSMQQALGRDNSTHGGVNIISNTCGDYIRAAVIHQVQTSNGAADEPDDSSGAPDFPNWPVWNDITHQKMWVDWIRRAYNGGLRVLVALAVNNKTLGDMTAGPGDYPTDDLFSADHQITETKSFVSRHSDFMEIAESSADVQRIVQANKLAVVLGVEIDDIGNLNTLGRVPQATDVVAVIGHLYDEGVRYIFPIHLLDNVFGGTAVYQDIMNYSNRREAGHWWNLVCSSDPSIGYRFDSNSFSGFLSNAGVILKLGPGWDSTFSSVPAYPQCGQVNRLGLTDLGTTALKEMMKRGMLIDIDHMSQNSADAAVAIAQSVPLGAYPLFSGHNFVRDPASRSNNERSLTPSQYRKIGGMHGMAGVGSSDAYTWVQKYLEAIQAMGTPTGSPGADVPAAAFGTDTQGLAMGMPPRRGSSVQYSSSFPMSSLGNKTWNYNTDGVAHYGMIVDFLADARTAPNGADLIDNNLMYGAQYFVDTWRRAEIQSTKVK
jgi:microsomal dipeptidase-like Zn-dependent dipeptidase